MSAEERPKLRIKRTAKGRIRGRPRNGADDGVSDMPPPVKRDTRPGKTTLDIVRRVVLASRLPDDPAGGGRAQAYMDAAGFARVEQTADVLDAVKRWLRDPARARPPKPERPS